MKRRYDWIFLDAGETLFRVGSPLAGFGQVLAEVGYPMTLDRLDEVVERARRRALVVDHVGPGPDFAVDTKRARARRERLLAAILEGIGVEANDYDACRAAIWESFVGRGFFQVYPEVPAVLARLRARHFRLGIISNWEPRLELLCHNHGLGDYFDFVLASEAEGYAKPGLRIFQRALELARVEPGRAVHVGDSFEHDVLGATALGIGAVLLDRGDYYPAETWQPTIHSLQELATLL